MPVQFYQRRINQTSANCQRTGVTWLLNSCPVIGAHSQTRKPAFRKAVQYLWSVRASLSPQSHLRNVDEYGSPIATFVRPDHTTPPQLPHYAAIAAQQYDRHGNRALLLVFGGYGSRIRAEFTDFTEGPEPRKVRAIHRAKWFVIGNRIHRLRLC